MAAVCGRAASLGIRAGEPLAAVRVRIPGLHVADADEAADARALERLAHWLLARYSPLVALDPPDGLLMEARGASHLWGGEARMVADLAKRLGTAGIAARIAIAPTATAARALARHADPPVTLVPPGGLEAAILPLPVAGLGLAPGEAAELRRLGLATIGDLARLPRAAAGRRLGLPLLKRLDQALGHVPEPLPFLAPPRALVANRSFAEPIATAEAIGEAIRDLVAELCCRLAAAGQGARRVDLRLARLDGSEAALRAGTAQPSRDPQHLARLLLIQVEHLDPGFGIERASLSATLAAPLAPEQVGEAEQALEAALDRIAARLGEGALWRPARAMRLLPEQSVARLPPLGPAGPDFPARLPRPARLLDPPETVDAIAMLPDRPPVLFTWRGVRHRVRAADGPERMHGEWWATPAERSLVRDYFIVEDEAGARFWLFRSGDGEDPATGDFRWYLQGLF